MNSSDLGRYGYSVKHSKMIKRCSGLAISCAFIVMSDDNNNNNIIVNIFFPSLFFETKNNYCVFDVIFCSQNRRVGVESFMKSLIIINTKRNATNQSFNVVF